MAKMIPSATWILLGGISLTQSAYAINRFDQLFKDVERSEISSEVRTQAQGVASMGVAPGKFKYPVPADFLDRTVTRIDTQGNAKGINSMAEALSMVMGSASLESNDGKSYFLNIPYAFGDLVSALSAGLIGPASATWVPSDSRSGSDDGRNLPENAAGTAFLVGPNLLLTNHHCVSTPDMCSAISFRFNYEVEVNSKALRPLDSYPCKRVVITDDELDFSLVEVEGNPENKYPILKLAARAPIADHQESKWNWLPPGYVNNPVTGESVTIIGHPKEHDPVSEGPAFQSIKKVSAPCRVTAQITHRGFLFRSFDGLMFHSLYDYGRLFSKQELKLVPKGEINFKTNCAILGGSSGSPVFNEKLNVIGIANRGSDNSFLTSDIEPESYVVPIKVIYERYKAQLEAAGITPIFEN